jgi:hypothetical protein
VNAVSGEWHGEVGRKGKTVKFECPTGTRGLDLPSESFAVHESAQPPSSRPETWWRRHDLRFLCGEATIGHEWTRE